MKNEAFLIHPTGTHLLTVGLLPALQQSSDFKPRVVSENALREKQFSLKCLNYMVLLTYS